MIIRGLYSCLNVVWFHVLYMKICGLRYVHLCVLPCVLMCPSVCLAVCTHVSFCVSYCVYPCVLVCVLLCVFTCPTLVWLYQVCCVHCSLLSIVRPLTCQWRGMCSPGLVVSTSVRNRACIWHGLPLKRDKVQ